MFLHVCSRPRHIHGHRCHHMGPHHRHSLTVLQMFCKSGICNDLFYNESSTDYSSIIIGKFLHAVSVWWGFASAADRQRLQALLQRGIHSGLCSPETPNLTELAKSVDDTLFQRIMHNPSYTTCSLNGANLYITYIRPRHHDRQLSSLSGQLCKRNFIYRTAYVVQRLLLSVL